MTRKPIMSPLRRRMVEYMRIRGMGASQQRSHIRAVREFAEILGRSPDSATAEDVRAWQLTSDENRFRSVYPAMSQFDVHAHLEALRRYARILTRVDQEAEDLVQGALLKAFERSRSFREGADLRVWLMSILHNHFIDLTRSRKASAARERAWAETNAGFTPAQGEHVVRLDQLRRAFLALPAEQAEALHLMAVEGLSVAETAAVLGAPVGTVMSRVGRAREALRSFEDGPAAKSDPTRLRLVRGRDDG